MFTAVLERGKGPSRLPWLVRVVLLITAAQALLLIAALFDPVQVKLLVPWPASPLNARFIAALYVSLGVGVAIASTARSFVEVRIILVGIVMATVILLVLTFVRMTLHPGELKQFPLLWVVFYIIDPLMIAVVFWRLRWGDSGRAGWRPVTLLWAAQAALFEEARTCEQRLLRTMPLVCLSCIAPPERGFDSRTREFRSLAGQGGNAQIPLTQLPVFRVALSMKAGNHTIRVSSSRK